LLFAAALSASLEVPRVARSTVREAAEELADAPAAITDAATRLVSAAAESHLGFDTNIYPGDKAMDAWRGSGEYEWVGYYLEAPCHRDDSWSGKRKRLTDTGWGLAVIYVGQQTWGSSLKAAPAKNAGKAKSAARKSPSRKKSAAKSRSPGKSAHAMARKSKAPVAKAGATCSAAFVNAARGRADAADAIQKTAAEGFARGTVIFLDIEFMETLPQPMRDYYRAWTAAVLADARYRPGVYAHTRNAATVYSDVRDVFDAAGVKTEPPFWIAGKRDFDIDKVPTEVGHSFAAAWQGMLDVVRTHNGVKLPIDISVSFLANPSAATD
jgi:hypothetical protein